MGKFFCEKVENRGVFVKKVESEGFVKKWTFPQRRVHYVFFILHFTYFTYAPNAPPCLQA